MIIFSLNFISLVCDLLQLVSRPTKSLLLLVTSEEPAPMRMYMLLCTEQKGIQVSQMKKYIMCST